MEYLVIEQRIWLNLVDSVRQLTEQVNLLSNRIHPPAQKQ